MERANRKNFLHRSEIIAENETRDRRTCWHIRIRCRRNRNWHLRLAQSDTIFLT